MLTVLTVALSRRQQSLLESLFQEKCYDSIIKPFTEGTSIQIIVKSGILWGKPVSHKITSLQQRYTY